MEREACVCDHGFERSDLCAEIIIIIILSNYYVLLRTLFLVVVCTTTMPLFVKSNFDVPE